MSPTSLLSRVATLDVDCLYEGSGDVCIASALAVSTEERRFELQGSSS